MSELLEKQADLMKSLQLYDAGEPRSTDISVIPIDNIVVDILEPVSNKTRLHNLKSLYYEPKTFSALSELTGLRACNLLSHLQKLLKTGMVIQRHEGGDYMITDKGYRVLSRLMRSRKL